MAELSTLGGVIAAAYEGQADKNAYTDAEKAKLGGVEAGANNYTLPAAGAAIGGVLQGAAVADSAAADVATMVSDFNALLASLRAAGVIGA